MSTVTCDAILVTVDGFGFGTLTGESCLKNVHCHTDRASWDAILATVVAFGALMWKKCAQSHRFGLGRWEGGGGDTIGGGGGVGEPRTGIIYTLKRLFKAESAPARAIICRAVGQNLVLVPSHWVSDVGLGPRIQGLGY